MILKIKAEINRAFFLFCFNAKSIANFTLPDEGEESPFKDITFVELQRDEASKLVEKYNKVKILYQSVYPIKITSSVGNCT